MNQFKDFEALNCAMKELGDMIPFHFSTSTWKATIPMYKVDKILHKHGIDIEHGRDEFVRNCESSLWGVSTGRPFNHLFEKCYILTYDKEGF